MLLNLLVVCDAMRKVNLANLYGTTHLYFRFYTHVHIWCNAVVLHLESPISSCANINLHVMSRGDLTMWNSFLDMRLTVTVEVSYTIHENNY